ncbi:PSD1 and planctomycete cytochrome C domain-containing protein, partial [bacterium]|nr:PSD1 and planctomycete cytochrome C domain-containing protein [bacterium]
MQFVFGLVLALFLFGSAYGDDESVELFEREIRPLLINKCSECHTGSMLSGGLNLESRESLLQGGESGSPLNLDQPEMSLLLQAIRRSDGLEMPPEDPLNDREIAAVEEWIKLGAPWPETGHILSHKSQTQRAHWAFQPISNPDVPRIENSDWGRNPIDAFILRRLNEAKLHPAPEADRRTLSRRLSYTLTGLPPSPEQVASFIANNNPQAYEEYVDELLASPRYGEHWARHWLDVARYSDTKGYVYAREERFWVHAWAYRDWVVDALNRDLPYDQFLRLQIAADQVNDCEKSDLAAMGFLTLGRRFLGVPWDVIDDRIDTLCRGTMGLTVACARCHDHKYDPIPTADYYSLYGVFASSEEQLVRLQDAPASDSYEAELEKRKTALNEKLRNSRKESSDRARSRVQDYLMAQLELEKYPAQGFDQIFEKDDLLPAFVRSWQAWLHQSKRSQEPVFAAWHLFREIPAEQFEEKSATVSQYLTQLPDDQLNRLVRDAFQTPPASFDEVISRYAVLLQQVDADWQAHQKNASDQVIKLNDPSAEQLRQVLYGPRAPSDIRDQPVAHIETFFDSGTLTELWKLQGEVDRWIINSAERVPHALILRDVEVPSDPRILKRGNPVNYGDDVPRQFLQLLSGAKQEPFKKGSGRRELADAITSPQNPLTARVIVNRVWAYHFGQGLVTTPSDFGLRSSPPS